MKPGGSTARSGGSQRAVSGLVRLGLAPGPAHSLAETLLAEITTVLRDVSLEVSISTPQRLIEWVLGDDLDVAISPSPGPVDPLRLMVEPLFDDGIVFVARSDHPLFQLRAPTIAQVFDYPVVLSGIGSRYKAIRANTFEVDLDRTPGRIMGLSFDLCLSIVMQGRHFTVGPRFVFRDELERQTLRALNVEVPFHHAIALLSRRDALPLPAVERIKQIVRDTLGQTAGSRPDESNS
jgi:DNA-binding transcriptional LysR family regulator